MNFQKLPLALDITNILSYVSREQLSQRQQAALQCLSSLREGSCPGSDFTGWLRPTEILSPSERVRISDKAEYLRNNSDVLLVIGIGGSYLGARAVIEALSPCPEKVVFAGQNISASYAEALSAALKGKRVALNVISKSGTTTEPAIALRLFEGLVRDKSLMAVTTDSSKGALLDYAGAAGVDTFTVPDNIGGRYSVLSAVGLLAICYAGLDTEALTRGAAEAAEAFLEAPFESNPALIYAAARHILGQKGYSMEIFSAFEPRLFYMAEWWKQLFGESEGKENTGTFPASCIFSTDLHSLGQYIQQGRRDLFETFVMIDGGIPEVTVPFKEDDTDRLNYLAGKSLGYINRMAYEATAKAHTDGGVPNLTVFMQKADERSLGCLIYFYELSCAVSCLLAGVNPFNQPGVEAYKQYMFRLLGKPGFPSLELDTGSRDVIAL